VFAYGQTSYGKTHTVLGKLMELSNGRTECSLLSAPSENWGIIPRSMKMIFAELAKTSAEESHAFMSNCQIYNEQNFDLLQD
jgi:hypothetical protein